MQTEKQFNLTEDELENIINNALGKFVQEVRQIFNENIYGVTDADLESIPYTKAAKLLGQCPTKVRQLINHGKIQRLS